LYTASSKRLLQLAEKEEKVELSLAEHSRRAFGRDRDRNSSDKQTGTLLAGVKPYLHEFGVV